MSTVKVTNLQHASSASANITLDSSGNAAFGGGLTGVTGINDGQIGGRRNLFINGAQLVWQRGTSQSVSGSYVADRWWMSSASSAAQSTDAPSGFLYSTKLTYSASDMAIGQPIELPVTGNSSPMVSGQKVTLSFYAKVDAGTDGIGAAINFRDNKFSTTNQVAFTAVGSASFTATTSWQRFTETFTIPTVAGTNIMAAVEITGISKDFYCTGFQLELGETATDFEHRSYGEELALCQRFYVGANTYWFTVGYDSSYTSRNAGGIPWSYQMRSTPTVSISSGSMTGHHNTAPTVMDSPTYYGVKMQFTGSALRTGANCPAGVTMSLSAEL